MQRLGLPLLVAVLALAGCGNEEVVKTVTQTVPASSSNEPPGFPPEESAGSFTKRHMDYAIQGQYGRDWDELHPVHQRLVTRSQYDSCERVDPAFAGNETVHVKETYDDPIDVRGIPEHQSKAVTIEIREPFEGGSATKGTVTVHAVNVDGDWRWILSDDSVASFRSGKCTDGSELSESPDEPPRTAPSKPIRFSGNGTRQLPPVTVRRDATLRWTHDGDFSFSVSDEDFDVNVSSEAPRGETFVPAGTYRFDVSADGNWTIVIR